MWESVYLTMCMLFCVCGSVTVEQLMLYVKMVRAWISDTKGGDQVSVNVDEEELEILKW